MKRKHDGELTRARKKVICESTAPRSSPDIKADCSLYDPSDSQTTVSGFNSLSEDQESALERVCIISGEELDQPETVEMNYNQGRGGWRPQSRGNFGRGYNPNSFQAGTARVANMNQGRPNDSFPRGNTFGNVQPSQYHGNRFPINNQRPTQWRPSGNVNNSPNALLPTPSFPQRVQFRHNHRPQAMHSNSVNFPIGPQVNQRPQGNHIPRTMHSNSVNFPIGPQGNHIPQINQRPQGNHGPHFNQGPHFNHRPQVNQRPHFIANSAPSCRNSVLTSPHRTNNYGHRQNKQSPSNNIQIKPFANTEDVKQPLQVVSGPEEASSGPATSTPSQKPQSSSTLRENAPVSDAKTVVGQNSSGVSSSDSKIDKEPFGEVNRMSLGIKSLAFNTPENQQKVKNIFRASPYLSKLRGTESETQYSPAEYSRREASKLVSAPEEIRCEDQTPTSEAPIAGNPLAKEENDAFDLEEVEYIPPKAGSGHQSVVEFSPKVKEEGKMDSEMGDSAPVQHRKGYCADVTPKLPSSQTSLNDSKYSAFDVGNSDVDSDDDDLLETPSVFSKIHELAKQSRSELCPSSPRIVDSESDSEPMVAVEAKTEADELNMDDLVQARAQQDKSDAEFQQIEDGLKDGLRMGGVRNIVETNECDESKIDIPEEIRESVRKLIITKQSISDSHPGDVIFAQEKYQQIFSYLETLTLESCGFSQGSSTIDKFLASLEPELLPLSLSKDFVILCFEAISCPEAFLNWLVQLLSVHPDSLVLKNAYDIYYYVITKKEGKCQAWVPSVQMIAKIFVNYGADINVLLPVEQVPSIALDELKSSLSMHSDTVSSGVDNSNNQPRNPGMFGLENLRKIYHAIADAASNRAECFQIGDIFSLIVMVLVTAADKRLTKEALTFDIGMAIKALIYAIPGTIWKEQVVDLCKIIHRLAHHHHDKVYLLNVMPPCDRVRYLQRRLAFSLLHENLLGQTVDESILNMKVKDLHRFVPLIKIKGSDPDYYFAASLIMLVDLSVGNETLPASEKGDLVKLTGFMKAKMNEVRETISVIDRSLIKDQIVRLTSKWTFIYQGMGSKERTLFAYTTTTDCVPEERIECRDDSGSDMDTSPMDMDDE